MASNAAAKAAQLASAVRLAAVGVASVYGLSNSIFNVEGGHRAVIFNRVVGIKDTVRPCTASARRARADVRTVPGVRGGHAPDGALVREAHHLRRARAAKHCAEHVGEQGPADGASTRATRAAARVDAPSPPRAR